jgi:Asp-tRNA(Asn)/Glu-tRNA(Gln) amidotransferase A subunit family amidase
MSGSDMAFLTIAELGAKLRAGEVSAVELAKACLGRLDSDGRRLHWPDR